MEIDQTFQIKCLKSSDGTIRYIKDSKLHNPEGPAVIYSDGKQEYYLNGISYTRDTHKKARRDGIGLPWYKSGAGKSRQ